MGFLALFIVATNQFHKWAHSDHPPRVAVLLQRWGLILSPEHHNIHHALPHDRQYCITVGWMNPLLNRIQFFRGVEAMVAAVRPEWLYLEERELFVANAAARRPRPPARHARAEHAVEATARCRRSTWSPRST